MICGFVKHNADIGLLMPVFVIDSTGISMQSQGNNCINIHMLWSKKKVMYGHLAKPTEPLGT